MAGRKVRFTAPTTHWVVDLDRQRVVTHEQPAQDGYGQVEVLAADAVLEAPEIGLASLVVADVLAAAERQPIPNGPRSVTSRRGLPSQET
jgi:hypothetical protein